MSTVTLADHARFIFELIDNLEKKVTQPCDVGYISSAIKAIQQGRAIDPNMPLHLVEKVKELKGNINNFTTYQTKNAPEEFNRITDTIFSIRRQQYLYWQHLLKESSHRKKEEKLKQITRYFNTNNMFS
jgi:hypothetical protein